MSVETAGNAFPSAAESILLLRAVLLGMLGFLALSGTTSAADCGQQREYIYAGNRLLAVVDSTPCVANLGITKNDGQSTVVAGSTVTYTIIASNAGPMAVTGAVVTDTFPAAITAVTWSCAASGGSSCSPNGTGNISQPVNLLSGGTATFTATATVSAGATGTLSNTATIAVPAGFTDPNPANNTATDVDTFVPPPTLSINDVSVTEGNTGTTNAVFTVTLSPAVGHTVTVNYATAGNTATSGTDFQAVSGTLTFTPGATTRTVTVPVIGDLIDEDNETFFVNLAGATNATIADAQGIGTIIDDDAAPTISIANCAAVEADSGTSSCAFHVSLSAPSSRTITVAYATADSTAIAGSDYLSASGTLTFNPGVSIQDALVSIVGNTVIEPNKTFFVNLSSPTNATIGQGQATGTITDNDVTSFFTVAPCRVIDTGGPPGPSGGPALAANKTRIFPAAGLCGIPATAKAIAVIVTTTQQTDSGDLRVYHADGALPGSTTINFAVNHARANNAIVPVGTAGQISVTCDMAPGSSGTTRLIVDVYGYFQ
jgi:uncharacterized repeat protein (TIGR01451 family)